MDSFFSNDDFLILPVINKALQGEIKSEAKRLNVGRSEESEQVEIRKISKNNRSLSPCFFSFYWMF